ncbi:MAG: YbjN domain-containing protein [Actinomycetota bacterium]
MSVPDAAERDRIEALIDDTLRVAQAEIDAVQAVERGDLDNPFWYVRMDGETKQHFSAEFTLGQRTLVVESYFMPEPEENRGQVFEHLLVRNRGMHPLHFVIGSENAIYLRGQVDNRDVDAECVDRLLAAVYEYTEQFFVPAMRLGYESRFAR